ncbi:hypothetical protein Taro_046026 [Colocasia esculenta]|uniref:Uncharacterized protein n=1 Tax=Colocasia esculenta TaxID=4460 RepID=A0A843WSQ0_COLES|nr:hypothetical protein [Colocasia esculenta]
MSNCLRLDRDLDTKGKDRLGRQFHGFEKSQGSSSAGTGANSKQSNGTKTRPESSKPPMRQNEDKRGKEPVREPTPQDFAPYMAEFQELPLEIIEQAINSTFQRQLDGADWVTVTPKKRFPLTFPKRGGSHNRSCRESTSQPVVQAKDLSPLEVAQAKKQEKNMQKNPKRRLKKQAKQAAAMMAPLELTPLQKLQKLIN